MKYIFVRPIFLIRAKQHARGESDLAYRVEVNNVFDCLPIVSRLKAYGYSNATFRRVGEERYKSQGLCVNSPHQVVWRRPLFDGSPRSTNGHTYMVLRRTKRKGEKDEH